MKKNKLLCVILPLVLISGCTTISTTSGIQTTGSLTDNGQFVKTVFIQNTNLAQKVQVIDSQAKWVGNLMKAQVSIHNMSYTTEAYQYKFTWYDSECFLVDEEVSNWNSKVLHGQASETLQGVAPNPSVNNFKLILRQQ